jgi:hypothetical protein
VGQTAPWCADTPGEDRTAITAKIHGHCATTIHCPGDIFILKNNQFIWDDNY